MTRIGSRGVSSGNFLDLGPNMGWISSDSRIESSGRTGRIAAAFVSLCWLVPLTTLGLAGWSLAEPDGTGIDQQIDEIPVQMTPDNTAEADASISRDLFMRDLLQGSDWVKSDEGPWTTATSNELIGVVQVIDLAEPIDVIGKKWPSIQYNHDLDTYVPYVADFAEVRGLTEIHVLVDLRLKQVVAVAPLKYTSLVTGDVSNVPPTSEEPS